MGGGLGWCVTTKRDDDERGETRPIQVSLIVQFSSITSTNSNGEQQQRRQQPQPQIIYITHTSAVHTANKQTTHGRDQKQRRRCMYNMHSLTSARLPNVKNRKSERGKYIASKVAADWVRVRASSTKGKREEERETELTNQK